MKLYLPAILAASACLAASCASTEPERLADIQARALSGCPGSIQRSRAAGDYDYDLDTCECVAKRITTPLWSDEESSYSGDPMPIKDARAIAGAINKGATFAEGLETARSKISVPASNSVNTCFAKR
ncbi:hypothetical protein WNY37_00890 [Henriciella sp. AS95]|uniref:hypothetical protein n=1 Tax=Henriciella sp. AS95 TaxID=3135782 RepID=UPI003173850E